MAATGWTYFVPYQPDPESALQDLRNDVFNRKAFMLPGDTVAGMSEQALTALPLPADKLQKMVDVCRKLDQVMQSLGAEPNESEKDLRGLERLIQNAGQEGFADTLRQEAESQNRHAATSIEHALELAEEAGTHSILDIDMTSDTPQFGHATPLSREELIALFGTDKPTADAVRKQQQASKLSNLRDTWEAAYFTVFTGDKPSEIVFTGSSGD